jgi:hypothetical protein
MRDRAAPVALVPDVLAVVLGQEGWPGEDGHPSPPACKTGRERWPLIRLLARRARVRSTSPLRSQRRFSERDSDGA